MKKEKVHSDEEVLSECDREPIHLSGAIQPSGALIAFDWNTLAITHLSQNLGDYFPVEPSGLIGLKLNEVSELSALWNALSGLHNSYLGQANDHRLIGVNSQAPEFSGQAKIISVHLSVKNDTAIVDIEDDEASPIELLSSFKLFAETIKGCRKSVSLSKCAHAIAESIRSIVKYDRVMVYKFDDDFNGTVIAESVSQHLTERFLGQKFPASDIPQQARALYVEKLVRTIADIELPPISLFPSCDSSSNQTLDLTQSDLRSVSPVHIAYLKNMGVRATLVMSLLDGNGLWGMIACHHYEPRYFGPKCRQACELISVLSANALVEFENQEENKWRLSSMRRLDELRVSLRKAQTAEDIFADIWKFTSGMLECDGLAFVFEDDVWCTNCSFSPSEAMELGQLARESEQEGIFFSSDANDRRLSGVYGVLAKDKWCGLTIVPVDGSSALIALRHRKPFNDIWAGRPEKAVKARGGLNQLQPRKSFEGWVDATEKLSTPWQDRELVFLEQVALIAAERVSAIFRRKAIETQKRLSRIVDQSNDSVIVTDKLGYITWANNAFVKLSGYRSSEVIGKKPGQLLQGPATDKDTITLMSNCIREKRSFSVTVLNYAKDGREYWIEVRCSPTYDENGNHEGFMALEHDVTEQRELLDLLVERDHFFRDVSRIADLGGWEFDYSTGQLTFSDQTLRILEVADDYVPSMTSFLDFFVPKARESLRSAIEEARTNGNGWDLELQLRTANSKELWVRMTGGRARRYEKNTKLSGAIQNVTEKKLNSIVLSETLDQVRSALAAKSTFLATMSHELRTPLNAIIGFSEIMRKERFGAIENERYSKYIKDIEDSGRHLLSLINDILDYSRVEAGKVDLRLESVQVSHAINAAVKSLSVLADQRSIEIKVERESDQDYAIADERALHQILLNVLSNAVKFSNPGETVRVSVNQALTNRTLEIAIEDNGIGIAADMLNKVGSPFFQVAGAYSREFGGTGLGLAITRSLTEQMNGILKIQSKLGEGTLVAITLPVPSI